MKKLLFAVLMLLSLNHVSFCQLKITDSAKSVALLERYFDRSMHFPAVARENRVSGQIIVAFWLGEDKTMSDLTILKSLDDNDVCENEVRRCFKAYNGPLLKIKPGEYMCSFVFVRNDEDNDEINDYSKVNMLPQRYRNFLFENKVIGYGVKKVWDVSFDNVAFVMPLFNDHSGNPKSMMVSVFVAHKNGSIYKDSLYQKHGYTFNAAGKPLEVAYYGNNNVKFGKTTYTYNRNGDEKIEIYNGPNFTTYHKTEIKRNAANQIVEEDNFYGADLDKPGDRMVLEYNDKGLEITEAIYRGDKLATKRTFGYVGKEKKFEKIERLDPAGNKTLSYFTNGVMTESYDYWPDMGFGSKGLFKYDAKNNRIEEDTYNNNDKLVFTNTYRFDDRGNKIEEIKYALPSNPGTRSTFVYNDYDKKGNWHTAKWLDGNTHIYYVVKREIVY